MLSAEGGQKAEIRGMVATGNSTQWDHENFPGFYYPTFRINGLNTS
jgi:hypothetical protein